MELRRFLRVTHFAAAEKDGTGWVYETALGPRKSENASGRWRHSEQATILPKLTYTPGVTVCQGPKWERTGRASPGPTDWGDCDSAEPSGWTEICATSGVEGDGGHLAAGGGVLFAIGEEEIGAAGGTEIADEDVLRAEAGGQELGTIGFAEIEKDAFGRRLVAGRHHVQPLDGVGFVAGAKFFEVGVSVGELRKKLRRYIGADFVAAAADAGADGGEDVAGIGGEVHLHGADSLGGDAS